MEVKISEILKKYDTDKNREHHYGGAYDEIFNKCNRMGKLNILEIGIQKGDSLLAWQEFFPNAKITGIDIVDVVKERNDKINYIISDINDYRTDETFDIIIDDGSHWLKDVVHSVSYLAPKLKSKGIFIIEDVQKADLWVATVSNILSPTLKYNKDHKYDVFYYNASDSGMSDDFLIIIFKK